MTIERVREEDAAELLEIYAPYVTDTAISFEYEVPTETEFKKRIAEISSRYPYLKAVREGRILGYAYANTFKERPAYDWSVETTIYLRQDSRREGVGRALYEELEQELLAMGIQNMNACIACPTEEGNGRVNEDSFRFHTRMGFSLVGRFHKSGYKFDEWVDMIWMEKLIGSHPAPSPAVRFGK